MSVEIGEKVRRVRKAKKFSMRELARRANMSHPYLSQLESGKNTNPSHDVLKRLSEALGVSLDFLIGYGRFEEYLSLLIDEAVVEKGISIEEILQKSGISDQYLNGILAGMAPIPDREELAKLGEALGVGDLEQWFDENTSTGIYGNSYLEAVLDFTDDKEKQAVLKIPSLVAYINEEGNKQTKTLGVEDFFDLNYYLRIKNKHSHKGMALTNSDKDFLINLIDTIFQNGQRPSRKERDLILRYISDIRNLSN